MQKPYIIVQVHSQAHTEFFGFIKYHLDLNNIYFYGVKINKKDVSAHTEERKIRNWDDENKNCKRKSSDDNKSAEEYEREQTETRATNTSS